MPEGPEVRIFAEGLNRLFAGKIITAIRVIGGRYVDKPPAGYKDIKIPLKIERIGYKGKFIYWMLDSGENRCVMFNTLGLTGGWTLRDTPYNRVEFTIDGINVYLFDVMNFATLKFTTSDELDKKLATIGVDVWHLSEDCFINSMAGISKPIADTLMNQKYVSGMGTYMVSEVLYEAKVLPNKITSTISKNILKDIYKAIKKVSEESYRCQTFNVENMDRDVRILNKYPFKVYSKKVVIRGGAKHIVKKYKTSEGRSISYINDYN